MADLRNEVFRIMRTEYHRRQIQRTVFQVEQKLIGVKGGHRNRINRLRVLYHGLPVFPQLKLLHPFDVAVPRILVLDLEGKGVKLIRQILGKLSHSQGVFIRLPDSTIIDIPDIPVRIEPSDRLEIIGEGIADADLIPLIPGIRMRLHFLQCEHDTVQIGTKVGAFFLSIKILEIILR